VLGSLNATCGTLTVPGKRGEAEIQRIAENTPCWADVNLSEALPQTAEAVYWHYIAEALARSSVSASNFDAFERRVLAVALALSELVGVAETAEGTPCTIEGGNDLLRPA
jgi:hypothetical protein